MTRFVTLWIFCGAAVALAATSASPSAPAAPASSTPATPAPTSTEGTVSGTSTVNSMNLTADLPPDSAEAVQTKIAERSLTPLITDIPSTYTFRASCIKKTYIDGFYKKQLNEPKLVRESNGLYILYATCLNGLGVPIDTKIKLKLIIRHIGDIRTISIRSIIDATKRYRNCADIANRNGVLECVPPAKK